MYSSAATDATGQTGWLNSIQAEWIALENLRVHPLTRLVFSRD